MAYGTNAGLTAYATITGRTVTGDPDVLRFVASQYINGKAFEDRWVGTAVDPYGDAWPRSGVTGISDSVIPSNVESATYEAALIYQDDPGALSSGSVTNNGSGAVTQEKVDVISVSYASPMNDDHLSNDTVTDNTPRYSRVEDILGKLLRSSYGANVAAFVV